MLNIKTVSGQAVGQAPVHTEHRRGAFSAALSGPGKSAKGKQAPAASPIPASTAGTPRRKRLITKGKPGVNKKSRRKRLITKS